VAGLRHHDDRIAGSHEARLVVPENEPGLARSILKN
jgi:hypothetical protein